jgi:hypothetical protein
MISAMRQAWLASTSLVALHTNLPPVTARQWARVMLMSGKDLGFLKERRKRK